MSVNLKFQVEYLEAKRGFGWLAKTSSVLVQRPQ